MTFDLALKSIASNKMRSFLTMLGVIIGVAAVITLVSLGQGATASVTSSIESMGSNLVSVTITGRGTISSLTYQEALEFKEIKGVKAVAPTVSGKANIKYGTKTFEGSVDGVNSEYQEVRNHTVQEGRFILPLDLEYKQRVALLGTAVIKEIFGTVNPIGETVQINGANFTVVGILEEKGTSMTGNNDEKIFIPLTTAQRIFQTAGVKSISIQAENAESVDHVVTELTGKLTKAFKSDEGFRVFNQSEMLSTVNQVTGTLTLMLGGIAGISLLVGGIGIMNIMLVSVTERTNEIGIRKAIGAKRRDILTQFLIEAIVISGFGGVLGVILGLAGSYLIGKLTGLTIIMSSGFTILAFSFSVFVGVFFGIYPADKASKLKPIDALRFE